jgi:hypothetical protein
MCAAGSPNFTRGHHDLYLERLSRERTNAEPPKDVLKSDSLSRRYRANHISFPVQRHVQTGRRPIQHAHKLDRTIVFSSLARQ